MRRLLLVVLVLGVSVAGAQDPPAPKGALEEGKNLPGAFHPFHVTGAFRGRFHCPVSQQGLDPMVLVFSRDLELTDSFKELLQKVDTAIVKNPTLRMRGFVVFLSDDLPDVVTNDNKREELAVKAEDVAKGANLQKVDVGLDSEKHLKDYGLEKDA